MLPEQESETVEFKSDRQGLSDNEIASAVMCLANGRGGQLFLGVEDDGTPTGLDANRRRQLDVHRLRGQVLAKLTPGPSVDVELITVGDHQVARFDVESVAPGLCLTTSGVGQYRTLDA